MAENRSKNGSEDFHEPWYDLEGCIHHKLLPNSRNFMYIAANYEPKPEKLMEDGKRKKESKPRKEEEEDGGGPLLVSAWRSWRWPEVVRGGLGCWHGWRADG